MRHAEKTKDAHHPTLSASDEVRRELLEEFTPKEFNKPDIISAAAISRQGARAHETVAPLSRRVGIPIDTISAHQDHGAVTGEPFGDRKYAGPSTVLCSHHGNILSLMHGLGLADRDYSDPWDRTVFNLILKVDFGKNGAQVIARL